MAGRALAHLPFEVPFAQLWIADFTPLGAASQAMQSAFRGGWPSALHVVVMLGFVAVLGTLATRLFRWT